MNPMPVTLKVNQVHGDWGVRMTIGVQSFDVNPFGDDKADGKWMLKQLKTALENAGCKVQVQK
jgi:uncharacterized lipoprotein YmbA